MATPGHASMTVVFDVIEREQRDGYSQLSLSDICKRTGYHKRTVQRALRALESLRLISTARSRCGLPVENAVGIKIIGRDAWRRKFVEPSAKPIKQVQDSQYATFRHNKTNELERALHLSAPPIPRESYSEWLARCEAEEQAAILATREHMRKMGERYEAMEHPAAVKP